MSEDTLPKKIFKLDIQTFITICVFVFGIGISRATITNGQKILSVKQDQILVSLEKIEKSQEKLVTQNTLEHKDYDTKFAFVDNRIAPTLDILASRAGIK